MDEVFPMTQTDTNTRITGLGFYLDEIEKPIFCIFLENHRQTIDAMSASASVRAFLDRICLDNGRINYDEADRLWRKMRIVLCSVNVLPPPLITNLEKSCSPATIAAQLILTVRALSFYLKKSRMNRP